MPEGVHRLRSDCLVLTWTDLEITDVDAISESVQAGDVRWQATELRLAQQLLLAHVIYPESAAHACQQAPLEGCQCAWNASNRGFVNQL